MWEVDEHALCRLGPQIRALAAVRRVKQQIELLSICEVSIAASRAFDFTIFDVFGHLVQPVLRRATRVDSVGRDLAAIVLDQLIRPTAATTRSII